MNDAKHAESPAAPSAPSPQAIPGERQRSEPLSRSHFGFQEGQMKTPASNAAQGA